MPAGVALTWRGARPLIPGAINRLAGPTTVSSAVTAATKPLAIYDGNSKRTLHAHSSTLTQCAFCQPRRTTGLRPYSTSSSRTTSSSTSEPHVVSWKTLARDESDRRRKELEAQQQQQQANAPAIALGRGGGGDDVTVAAGPRPVASPGAIMLENMSREPPSPRPGSDSDRSSSPSAASTSALTKPIIHYTHPKERARSRKRHVKSVVRQGRLEIMRQVQNLQLADWRQILRRLALYTPREDQDVVAAAPSSLSDGMFPMVAYSQLQTPVPDLAQSYSSSRSSPSLSTISSISSSPATRLAGWRKNAVLFALPNGSSSIEELQNGVDDSMWAIWGRTSCVLKLFRWQDSKPASTPSESSSLPPSNNSSNNSNDPKSADRPWLLSLSGTESALSRAIEEVRRFAKDAEPVAMSPADKDMLDDGASSRPLKTKSTPPVWKLVSTSHYLDAKYYDDPVFAPYVTSIGAHEIPRPDEWTPDSFERYVAALTNGVPPPQLASKIYHNERAQRRRRDQGAFTNDVYASSAESLSANTYTDNPIVSSAGSTFVGSPPPSHSRVVIDLLHEIFHDEAARPAVTLSAFKMALAYMCKFGEAKRPDVRALFVRMEMLRLPMDTETFNIVLASHVKSQDVRSFGTTLRLMHNHNNTHTPDLVTWLLFLRLFWSEEVKRHILYTMYAKGLLSTSRAVRLVALEMAEHDAERAIQQLSPSNPTPSSLSTSSSSILDEFMARQAERYGQGWLSRAAANRILDVFASHGRFSECNQLLETVQKKQQARIAALPRDKAKSKLKPKPKANVESESGSPSPAMTTVPPTPGFVTVLSLDTITYNIVLTHCKVQNDIPSALAILRRMEAAGSSSGNDGTALLSPIPPDSATYHLLFALAWENQLPHMMAVAWHYACVNLQARHWILQRVSHELVERDGHTIPLALFLSGDDMASSGHDASDSGSFRRPSEHIGIDTSARIAERYRGWEPDEPLSKVLQEAIERDDAMRAGGEMLPPMRILLRRKVDADAPDADTSTKTYMEIPVPWGEFKTVPRSFENGADRSDYEGDAYR